MDIGQFILQLIQSPIFIISVIFWFIAFLLVKLLGKKKENITLFFPFLLILRIKKFNRFFQKIARCHPKLWRIWWSIGVVFSFIFMLGALYFFISNFIQLIVDPQPENAILPLIPGVTIDLPIFSYLLLPLLLTITVHECSHAIAAEIDGVHVKSSGILGGGLFFIIAYGAFVEVDEFQLYSKKISSKTRLRVAAAGVWSNIILAGIVLLLLNFFPSIMHIGYRNQVFQITGVVSTSEGGFNENNLEIGDTVIQINNTLIDLNAGKSLDSILSNQTDIKVAVGDSLVFSCQNPKTGQFYNRSVLLGFRSFVGFEIEKVNNTAFKIIEITSALLGGNNYNKNLLGKIIVAINGTGVDYSLNKTLNYFLFQTAPNYRVNLTTDQEELIEIDVNYYPRAAGAHLLYNVYLGIDALQIDDYSFQITAIMKNETEYGVNEGRIPEETIITAINGISLNLTNTTLKNFILSRINPISGDKIIVTDNNNRNYTLICSQIPIIPVYVGITSRSFWMPSNWFGRLLGGNFPNEIYNFLLFTWMVSFSLALFNLLPTTIFDGGRLLKEVINAIIGTKAWDLHAHKKIRYEYSKKDPLQHLFTHNITQILSVQEIISSEPMKSQKGKRLFKFNRHLPANNAECEEKRNPLKFRGIDSSQDGNIDTVELIDVELLPEKSIIEVEVEYEYDLKSPLKQTIHRSISWVVGLIILGSFLISIIKFNKTLFWL